MLWYTNIGDDMNEDRLNKYIKFNVFSFLSAFSRALIETFVSLYLFKNGFGLTNILLFYIIEHLFAALISIGYVKLGEKRGYSIVMYIGILFFIVFQFLLVSPTNSLSYIILLSLIYALYRRGYWVARRFYIINIMPKRNTTESFSILVVMAQIASILAGYVGAIFLDDFSVTDLTILSSILLLISVLPLTRIKYKNTNTKIELIKNLKKYDKRNYLAFSIFELRSLVEFLFPIYIAIYIQSSYVFAGTVNAVTNLAIIIFVLVYGKVIKKKNYFVLSCILFFILNICKLYMFNYLILIIYLVEGFIKNMQNQSTNKIFFENRGNMDITHYNLIYQILECMVRAIVCIPLLFMKNISDMILFVIIVMMIGLVFYNLMKKNKKLQ